MKGITTDIGQVVSQHAMILSAMSEKEFSGSRGEGKWSKKEILGHLIDSAQNNIQRFVRGQYETNPKIVYSQNDWVKLQDYKSYPKDDLVQLWVLINRHLCRVLNSMDLSQYQKNCDTGKTAPELHSLHFLAKDYLVHLLHHVNQIEEEISLK